MAASSSRTTLALFTWVVATVALLGIVLAYVPGPWKDATREIGGALVAGAVVGGLVLWFEERREDQRVDREAARDSRQFEREEAREEVRFERDQNRADQAGQNAWRRELDIQLVRLVHSELGKARTQRLTGLHEAAIRHKGQTHTPEMLESVRRLSDRTASDLVVRQIIEVLNLLPSRVRKSGARGLG